MMNSCFAHYAFDPRPPSWKPFHGYWLAVVSFDLWSFEWGQHSQDSSAGEVTTIAEVGCSHHVLWVVHLLRELWNADGTERVGATRGERRKSNHEEVETWERNHVDSQFAEVRVKLSGESERG